MFIATRVPGIRLTERCEVRVAGQVLRDFRGQELRIGDFQIDVDPATFDAPHCLVTLRPWINVGNVGRISVNRIGRIYGAKKIGQLARPGKFLRPHSLPSSDPHEARRADVPNSEHRDFWRARTRRARSADRQTTRTARVGRGLQRLGARGDPILQRRAVCFGRFDVRLGAAYASAQGHRFSARLGSASSVQRTGFG